MEATSRTLTWVVTPEAAPSAVSPSAGDHVVISRFLDTGNDEYFDILVRRYREGVFRLTASILGPGAESDAEDVTQEVFILVYRKLDTFREDCAFATWIYRLARNRAIDYRRSAAFGRFRLDAEFLQKLPDESTLSDPQRIVVAGQRQAGILKKVDDLGEPQRTVVFLHYWLDRTTAEIAELLGLSPGTVKSHLHRARHKLSRALREEASDG